MKPKPKSAKPATKGHVVTTTTAFWVGQRRTPPEYDDCALGAVRRMAILLNAHEVKPISMSWLKKGDADIRDLFDKHKLEYLHDVGIRRSLGSAVGVKTEIDRAENGFYGTFSFSRPRKTGPGLRVGVTLTPVFHDWSYQKLEKPQGSDAELQRATFKDESNFMQDCATNYLLKNFWHNYVHNALQDLHEKNYWRFNGQMTEENDFEADNLATLLLVRSYGLPLATGGRQSPTTRAAIRGVVRRNRCNRVFVEREEARRRYAAAAAQPTATPRDLFRAFAENEWYFRRRIANALSNRLVEDGHVVTQLGVYLTDEPKLGRRGPYRTGQVVIQLNGWSIDTGLAPYITDPLANDAKAQHRRETQSDRIRDVVALAASTTGHRMKTTPAFRNYASGLIEALGVRMGGVRF